MKEIIKKTVKRVTKGIIKDSVEAIIMAAGESTRTWPLTINRPKPLLLIGAKRVIEQTITAIKKAGIKRATIIIGFKGEQIKEFLGTEYQGIKIRYVEQKERRGTGHALITAADELQKRGESLSERILIIPGDDFFTEEDLKKMISEERAILCKEVENPERFGIMAIDEKGYVKEIEEKPKHPKTNLANTACWLLRREDLELLKRIKESPRGEIEATDLIGELYNNGRMIRPVVAENWMPIGYPWQLLDANKKATIRTLSGKKICREKRTIIEEGVQIKGPVLIRKETIIMRGTIIKGPAIIGSNNRIGPGAIIGPYTTTGEGVTIERAELKDSIIDDNTIIKSGSIIKSSITGKNCIIGEGTITTTIRYDGKTHKSMVKGELTETNRTELGVIMGDNSKTGPGTITYPGRKIDPGLATYPGDLLKNDLEECQLITKKKGEKSKQKIEK